MTPRRAPPPHEPNTRRTRPELEADARMLVKIWRARAQRAERDGDAYEVQRCMAAVERWQRELEGK